MDTKESGAQAERSPRWDGTTKSGIMRHGFTPPNEGDASPPIRGTATSAIELANKVRGTEERAYEIRGTHPIPSRRMWPAKAVEGKQDEAQAT